MEKHEFYCSVIPWNCTWYCTVQVLYFSLLNRLLRIRLKCQNPLLSYIQEREKVHCECTMWCTIHFIITLFNVDNVLLCVIYQLNVETFYYQLMHIMLKNTELLKNSKITLHYGSTKFADSNIWSRTTFTSKPVVTSYKTKKPYRMLSDSG